MVAPEAQPGSALLQARLFPIAAGSGPAHSLGNLREDRSICLRLPCKALGGRLPPREVLWSWQVAGHTPGSGSDTWAVTLMV